MRNLRNIALAGATAVALTFGGTSVAVAADGDQAPEQKQSSNRSWQTQLAGSSLGIQHGDSEEAKKTREVTGGDLWGTEKNLENVGKAGKTLYGLTIALAVFAGLTALAAPIYNFFKFGPFAK